MATWDFGTSNRYITGRVNVSYSYNGIAANSYNVSVSLYYYKNSTSSTYGKVSGALCGYGYTTGKITLNSSAGWVNVANVSFTVGADAAGNASCNISASGGISGTTFSSSSMSQTLYMSSGQTRQWTISYNANGGSGAPAGQTKTYGQTLTLSSVKPTREGYNFLGWATSSTATTATYQPGGSYTTNAGTTLYAVWQVATLIDLTYTDTPYTVLSDKYGKVTTDSLSSLSLSFDTVYITENKNTNFYVRISNSNGDNPTIFGPYTATNNPTLSLPLPKIMILSALKTMSSNTEFKLNCDTCTGSNSFSKDTTSSKIISVTLNNFKFLSQVTSKIAGYRNSNGTAHCELAIQYSPSYSSASSNIVPEYVKVNGTTVTVTPTKSLSSSKEYTYKFDLSTSQLATNTSGIIAVCFTDNITTTIVRIRVNSVGNEKIYINETYNSKSNVCRCSEFIEVDTESEIGFQKGGKVIAHEFIETDSEVQIGDTMYFGELVEI